MTAGDGAGFADSIARGLAALTGRFGVDRQPSSGRPIFLLAGAWRSGSTLLQRLVTSSGEALIWGEPYDHSGLIRRLAESVRPFNETWPPMGSIVDPTDPPNADAWIANAYPHPADLIAAHRAFFDRMFATPAAAGGHTRWGVKGVRLSGDHARYLDFVLGDPQFVFLHRNPYDAFLSYRVLHEIRPKSYWWYRTWPDDQISTAGQFGAMWGELVASFRLAAPHLTATIVRYEDLITGDAIPGLESFLGIDIKKSVLDTRVGGSDQQRGEWEGVRTHLSPEEVSEITEATGGLAVELGYLGPEEASA